LALGWAQIDHRIREIRAYIRDNIEKDNPVLGWETHLHGDNTGKMNCDPGKRSDKKMNRPYSNWQSLARWEEKIPERLD
jgi:hypothetical protein